MSRLLKGVLLVIATLLSLAFLFSRKGKTPDDIVLVDSHDMRSWNFSGETSFRDRESVPPMSHKKSDYYLSPEIVARVEKFVFFVGYARSGHSIIGALMDAHPHVVIAHEFFLFSMFSELNKVPRNEWKNNLFQLLSKRSARGASKQRAEVKKGYSLEVKGQWQGKFDKYIAVIGDKSGGATTIDYLKNKPRLKDDYRKMRQTLSIPIRIIHAVRNPFDIISTKLNYRVTNTSQYRNTKLALQSSSIAVEKLQIPDKIMIKGIKWLFSLADGVVEMIEEVFGRENVLEVHNCDLVYDPRGTISRIFQFLEVDTSEEYLDACEAKVFKSVSRSRDTIEWSPRFRAIVEGLLKKYKFFNRYSFSSD